jgi:hypothetical protein
MVGRTPWSAADAPVGLFAPCKVLTPHCSGLRDEGVPRGPGGPPHHQCGLAALAKRANPGLTSIFGAVCRKLAVCPRVLPYGTPGCSAPPGTKKGGGWAAPFRSKLQASRTKLRTCTSVRTRSRAARCSYTTVCRSCSCSGWLGSSRMAPDCCHRSPRLKSRSSG